MAGIALLSLIVASCVTPGQGVLSLASSRTHSKAAQRSATPISEVIELLNKMRNSCEEEGNNDLKEHDKKQCFCQTTEERKTASIEKEGDRIAELQDLIQQALGRIAVLKTEISELDDKIKESQATLNSLNSRRDEDHEEFVNEENDLMEQAALLKEAIAILEKVAGFAQVGAVGTGHGNLRHKGATNQALQQIQSLMKRTKTHRFRKFTGVMQRDLYDFLGAVQKDAEQQTQEQNALPSLLEADMIANGEQPDTTTPPAGVPGRKPNELKGYAAGAKSYNSRSGKILGMITQMKDQVERDIGLLKQKEAKAQENYEKLKESTQQDIDSFMEQRDNKKGELADLKNQEAQAKADMKDESENRVEDQQFVFDMKKACEKAAGEYEKRAEIRTNELAALDETLKILTADDARSLYEKTGTFFMQLGSRSKRSEDPDDEMSERLMKLAKERKSQRLALIAQRVKIDAFTKVKEAMDTMITELKSQQSQEYQDMEDCKAKIDTAHDELWSEGNEKEDLDGEMSLAKNKVQTLTSQIKTLNDEVLALKIELKKTGEQRKEANDLFQTAVSDQRATSEILAQALDRLEQFYGQSDYTQAAVNEKSYQFLQIQSHSKVKNHQKGPDVELPFSAERLPGDKVDVEKRGGAVLVKLAYIIKEAKLEEEELVKSETSSQKDYAKFVQDTSAALTEKNDLIATKQQELAEAISDKEELDEELTANENERQKQKDLLTAHHAECDYLIKYFDIRQKARLEEIGSVQDAKGILAGAKFAF